MAGLDTSILSDVRVIKEGGRLKVGKIVGHIGIKEAEIQRREYERIAKPIFDENEKTIINPVLGMEKLLMLATGSKREILENMNLFVSYVGDTKRIAYYFVNVDILRCIGQGVLYLFEELASTIIRINKQRKSFHFSVLKSVNNELDKIEIKI
ncbi:hypothetical protein E3E31_03855 [Thermococcus sp. M39]|nr:hypothetical protein [Thermococcus sp. M39]